MTRDAHHLDRVTDTTPGRRPPGSDAHLAAALADGAGSLLRDLHAQVDAGTRSDATDDLRRAGDSLSHAYLAAALERERPGDAVLSEEGADDPRRLAAERVWIVDPLDGTREFAEREPGGPWRDDFAVHVALWQRGAGLTDAAVGLPARGVVLRSDNPPHPTAAAADVLAGRRPLRIAVSRTRPPAVARRLGERRDVELGRPAVELVPMGSTGAKVAAVLEGVVDAYVHAGGQYEWDSAAPVAVACAAGFVATRLDGSPIAYNQADPWSPDLLVCHPALHDLLRALLAAVGPVPEEAGARR
jgi:3'(2'), 5'-bisphosphate nucleotidase